MPRLETSTESSGAEFLVLGNSSLEFILEYRTRRLVLEAWDRRVRGA
jgi:hypothetical protein